MTWWANHSFLWGKKAPQDRSPQASHSRRVLGTFPGALGLGFSTFLLIAFLWRYIFVSESLGSDLEGIARGLLYLALLPGWSFALVLAPLVDSSHQLLVAGSLSAGIYLLLICLVYMVLGRSNLSLGHLLSNARVGGLLQVGILILLVFPLLFAQATFVYPDSMAYMTRALNISRGLGYTEFGVPVINRGPVYPYLLSIAFRLFGVTASVGLLVPKLVGVLNFFLVYWLGRSLFGGWSGFLGAVLAVSCNMLRSYFFTSHLLDGALALFMNLSLLCLFIALKRDRHWIYALSGISLGAAVLTKETGIMWASVPWIVLFLSKRHLTIKRLVGIWLSTAAFFITLYPWIAYVYSVDQHIFLLKSRGDHTIIWFALNLGITLYLLIGIVLILCQKCNLRLFSRYSLQLQRKARVLRSLGGVVLLIAAMVGIAYIYEGGGFSQFTLSFTIGYLQDTIRPVFGDLFIFVMLTWCLTLVLAFQNEEHRLLAIPFLLVVPLFIHLSRYKFEARNYIMIVLLSYLLLGHYLNSLARWIIRKSGVLVRWQQSGAVARLAMLLGLCILVSRPSTLVTEQCTQNQLTWEKLGHNPFQDVKDVLSQSCAGWINAHVEPGTPILSFTQAWPTLVYFMLDARYPITILPFNQMNSERFWDSLTAGPKERIVYVRRARAATYTIFNILSEAKLYKAIDRERAEYIVVGGKHISLFGTVDFFQRHPAFEQVFRDELRGYGIAIYRVKPELLRACQACPTVVDDWAFHQLLELVASKGMDEYEFLQRLGANISMSYQPALLDLVGHLGREGDKNIPNRELFVDFKFYLDKLGPNIEPGSEKQLLVGAYIKLGEIYREHGDIGRSLIAYQQAVTLDPELQGTYGPDIQLWRSSLLEHYSSEEGAELEVPLAVQSGLPELARDIYYARGQLGAAVLAYRQAMPSEIPVQRSRVVYDFLDHFASSGVEQNPRPDVFTIGEEIKKILFQHPSSVYTYTVTLPSGSTELTCDIALSPEVWGLGKGDGVRFDIGLYDAPGSFTQLFSRYIDPKNNPHDRKWHSCGAISLEPWAGQTVTITFATSPNNNALYDWAGWGEPRIVQPAYYSFLEQLSQATYTADVQHIRRDWMVIDEDLRDVLFQHSPTQITYNGVEILDNSTLYFGIGIDPQVWSPDRGDGVEFEILIQDAPHHLVRVFDQTIDPQHNPDDRRWLDVQVDLGRFAGQTVNIRFVTHPGPAGNSDYDWAVWSNPVLVAVPSAALRTGPSTSFGPGLEQP